jgi:hypothetical protein
MDKYASQVPEVEEELTEYIRTASADLSVKPYDLQYNQLQKWFKENDPEWLAENSSTVKFIGGFTALRDLHFPRPTEDLPVRGTKVKESASVLRKEMKLASREQSFLDRLDEILEKYAKTAPSRLKLVSAPKAKSVKAKGVTRELNILLSDLHIGSDLDSRYGPPLKFGKLEEARRLAHVVKTVCSYKQDHRDETRLRVHLGGDIIQGQLHDMRDGDILAAQVARAIHLLGQAISRFCNAFPAGVVVDCTPGNHDRITSRHKERATYEKTDSLATMIYYAVKKATAHFKNLQFDITRAPFVAYESFGAKCFGTHGDTVLNPGYPGSVINAKNLETQINRINASLANAEEYKLFWVGHVHVGTVIHMGNGSILITNGALIPSDQYSISIGLFENACGQSMWESVPGHVVGDYRFINVNGGTDKDESLDEYIVPFVDF